MAKARTDFGNAVLECVEDINGKLPGLAERFNVMVVVCAFAQHVGAALRLLMRRKTCDAQQARLVLRHIEKAALRGAAQTRAGDDPDAPGQ